MSQQELLIRVVQALDEAGIGYMVTGSLVSSLQGEPRATHDIDFVISIDRGEADDAAERLAAAFPPPGYHLDADSIRAAVRSGEMFNLIDVESGDKADFWLLTDDDFDRERFSRRQYDEITGERIAVSTPEDTILMKLRWAVLSGGSEKQYTDALRVYEVQSGDLDAGYLEGWAERLGVAELLERLKEEAEAL
jgi:hypothetical protein